MDVVSRVHLLVPAGSSTLMGSSVFTILNLLKMQINAQHPALEENDVPHCSNVSFAANAILVGKNAEF